MDFFFFFLFIRFYGFAQWKLLKMERQRRSARKSTSTFLIALSSCIVVSCQRDKHWKRKRTVFFFRSKLCVISSSTLIALELRLKQFSTHYCSIEKLNRKVKKSNASKSFRSSTLSIDFFFFICCWILRMLRWQRTVNIKVRWMRKRNLDFVFFYSSLNRNNIENNWVNARTKETEKILNEYNKKRKQKNDVK